MSAHRVSFRALWAAIALLAAAVAACAGPLHEGELSGERTVPGDCRVRLIVGLSQAPDERLIADLARVSAARLEVLGTVSPGRLYVLSLTAAGAASECAAAIARLRQDPHVRSADVDVRRKHDAR